MLRPIIFDCLKGYTRKQLVADLTAGLIVGILTIPLSIAFAIASGVSPEKGLVTAFIGGFILSLLGGSRVQICGPTGAFVILLFGIVQRHGIDGLATATLMAGLMLTVMGFSGLGSVIKFIPYPVTVGFTSGIAVIIFTSQINDLLGLSIVNMPAGFIDKWAEYARVITGANRHAAILGGLTLLLLIFWPRINRRVPGALVAIVAGAAAAKIFGLDVETIGSRFGDISSGLPAPVMPNLNYSVIRELVSPAISIALLGAIEALLSATVADGMLGGKHRSNMELVAQGAANIVSPLFGGIPATGAIARTATNIRNGGRTPIAGIAHALVALLIMLCLGRWVKLIPLASLSAVLVMVAYHMSEWRTFVGLFKNQRSDVAVLVITFALTVLADLTEAIQVGVVLSAILFMRRLTAVSGVEAISREISDGGKNAFISEEDARELKHVPPGTDVYEINGPFFFGTAFKFEEGIESANTADKRLKVRILRMRNVPVIDSTGLNALRQFSSQCNRQRITLILSGVQPAVLRAINKAGLDEQLGPENITSHFKFAVERAKIVHGWLVEPQFGEVG
jgi:SulP family sulfate permease